MSKKVINPEEVEENFSVFNSYSLYIVEQVLAGRKLSKQFWDHVKKHDLNTAQKVLIRLPDGHDLLKRKIIDLFAAEQYLHPNRLKEIVPQLKSSPNLVKYLLSAYRRQCAAKPKR